MPTYAAAISPGDFRRDRRSHGAARPGLPGDGDAPDRRGSVAGPCAREPGRSRWTKPTVRELLDGLYEAGIAAEAWRTDLFPELEPAADDPSGRLHERRASGSRDCEPSRHTGFRGTGSS